MAPKSAIVNVLALAVALAGEPLAAQPEAVPEIRVDVDLVNILCSVRDSHGVLLPSLTRDDFVVFEDDRQQSVRYFRRDTDLPLTVGLLVDTSRSQIRLLHDENVAARQFLHQVIRKQDRTFLIAFDNEPNVLMNSTSSEGEMEAGLRRLEDYSRDAQTRVPHTRVRRPGGTALYDAIHFAATSKLENESGRKVIVVITDGIDTGSRLRLGAAVEAAQRADTLIYGINYSDRHAYPRSAHFDQVGQKILERMSQETGGRVFRVDRGNPLKKVFAQIQEEVRTQYAIAYKSTNPSRDGGFRRVEVSVDYPNARVQARRGYYAPKETSGVKQPAAAARP